jgi:NTP pyrophosphatase (non-canonical NTP hydrolase)
MDYYNYMREFHPKDVTDELMVITGEEAAEVIQETSKIIRFGISPENRSRLEKELGDFLCMYELMCEMDIVDPAMVAMGAKEKREKLKVYSSLIKE